MRIRRKKKQQPNSQTIIQPKSLQRPFDTSSHTEQTADLQAIQEQAQQPGLNFGDISIFSGEQSTTPIPIQAKLTIGQPNDKYEQEADRVATHVVQTINSPEANQPLQRTNEEEEEVQTKPLNLQDNGRTAEASTAPSEVEQGINQAKGGGQPLAAKLQQKMGNAMGADFSGVRVHTDNNADKLNQSIQAKAFTTGRDVFFKQGAYQPNSRSGQELIAHELTHVVQQNSSVAAKPVQKMIQTKWLKDSEEAGLYKWDKVLGGLQWYSKDEKLKYVIRDATLKEQFPHLVAGENNYYTEEQFRGAGWKFTIDSPIHRALSQVIEKSPLELHKLMVQKGMDLSDSQLSETISQHPTFFTSWYASTICDLTSVLVMYEAMGIENMESIKDADNGNELMGNHGNPNLTTSHLKQGDENGLLNAFNAWANQSGAGVMQLKFVQQDAHTFAIEKIALDNNLVFKIFQSYQGLYTLKEFMNADAAVEANDTRQESQVEDVKATRDAFGGGQVFGKAHIRNNVIQVLQDCLGLAKDEESDPLKAKAKKIIGKVSGSSPQISDMVIIYGSFSEDNMSGFADKVADDEQFQSIKDKVSLYLAIPN